MTGIPKFTEIDFEVGEILGALRDKGLLENTVVILSSDHGDYLGDHNLIGKASHNSLFSVFLASLRRLMSQKMLILLKAYLALRGNPPLTEWFRRFTTDTFGELMMFVYFGYMLPFSTRITRGLYADGLWTDSGFMPYEQVGGISWRGGTLVVISRHKSQARRMDVPSAALGELRRHLRDKISSHDIEIDEGPGIHLGTRDARDSV